MRLRVHTGALLSTLLFASAAARAAVYLPIEDGELFRRAAAVVVGTSLGSHVVAGPGGLPETRTRFAVVDSLRGGLRGEVEVVTPGGALASGLELAISDVPRFASGARYVLALSVGGAPLPGVGLSSRLRHHLPVELGLDPVLRGAERRRLPRRGLRKAHDFVSAGIPDRIHVLQRA